MIIIEETEEDKNRAALPDEDSFEDEELTTEEAKYRSAKDLRDRWSVWNGMSRVSEHC